MKKQDGQTTIANYFEDGFHCVILEQNWSGHLCGYVEIPEGHILHDVSYNQYEDGAYPSFRVHGGITYSGGLNGFGGFYIGFDCAHSGDICPKSQYKPIDPRATYRDEAYVRAELKDLVSQIKRTKRIPYTAYKYVIEE
jgi:hypothetical protein